MDKGIIRFAGVSLSHDPKSLRFTRKNEVVSERMTSGELRTSNMLEGIRTVSGKGELFGENCAADLKKLMSAYSGLITAPLSIPYLGAINAALTDISFACEPREGYIAVEFTFTAVSSGKMPKVKGAPYITASAGSDLWDIAYDNGVSVDSLVKLNPHIRFIENLNSGERVRLY